ncbi:hypothetical protein [Bacillus subtilis]|uniref:hypothetical protein n=1 Tax=Bacillus subtilis TaxID=1423 RepID=UPI0016284B28|nr:hypothetical protein [Bacillus subtilis]
MTRQQNTVWVQDVPSTLSELLFDLVGRSASEIGLQGVIYWAESRLTEFHNHVTKKEYSEVIDLMLQFDNEYLTTMISELQTFLIKHSLEMAV